MANETDTDLFGLLCQLATFSEWHSPKFGTLDFQVTEDALRKIFPWESSFTNVQSGSLAEKLYLPSLKAADETGSSWLSYEADLDVMFIPQKVVIWDSKVEDTRESGKDAVSCEIIAYIEDTETPGYIKLRVNNTCKSKLPDEILEIGEGRDVVYISSSKFSRLFGKHLSKTEETGPSQFIASEHIQHMSSFGIMKSVDLVFAFRCPQWPSAAREWVNRKRHWPTSETVHGIIQQGCAAVAKGFAESASSHLEWRLSFSLAEVLLARSLTAVQRQCYLLVKNLIKDLKCNVIPSYYIKCSFFWLLEDTETNVWRSSNLGNCVLMALNKLQKCLRDHLLPNYFVRQGNLLQMVPKDSCDAMSNELMNVISSPVLSLANSSKIMERLELVMSAGPKEKGCSKLITLLREQDGSTEKKDELNDLLKFHFYNLGLSLMNGEPETAQKGLDYIQSVVAILKTVGKCTNALELLCNSLVSCSARGDDRLAAARLVSMRILGFLDDEVISTLHDATGSNELGAHLCHNAGCLYHTQAYVVSGDGLTVNKEHLSHAETMLKKAVDLEPGKASHHAEFSMFLYRNDRFDEAISFAKRGVQESASSEVLDCLEYDTSEEITLDGNLGYHVQQNGFIRAPALVFAYYVQVACLEELNRKDEALQLMDSYKSACSDSRKTHCEDDSMVLFRFSCLLLKVPVI